MEIQTAFLHGDIDEEIYMKQTEDFVALIKEHLVYKLIRSLSGLKQAPRQWYEKFDTIMVSQDFDHSNVDHCLYTKKDIDENPIVLILYVNDMLLVGK